MLLKRLREDTADLHAAVERRVEVTDGRLTAGRGGATPAGVPAAPARLRAAVGGGVEVTDGRLTAGRYVATLAAFHGFHAPWEAGVRAAAGPAGLHLPAAPDLLAPRRGTRRTAPGP